MHSRQAFFTFYFFILIFVLQPGCRPSPPSNATLADLYVKVLIVNQEYSHTDSSFSRKEYDKRISEVFATARINPADFRAQLVAVAQSPDDYAEFYERVTTILSARRKAMTPPAHS